MTDKECVENFYVKFFFVYMRLKSFGDRTYEEILKIIINS